MVSVVQNRKIFSKMVGKGIDKRGFVIENGSKW
jgi:hypothetical protein